MRKILAGLIVLLLCGCGIVGTSPKTHFYTLDALSTPGGTVRLAHPVTVAAVHIPPSLDRDSLILHSAGNAVAISGTDRWTGPLGAMARRVLSEDLAAHLSPASVILPDAPAPSDTRRIVVTILRFGPASGGDVVLDANWSLLGPAGGAPVLSRDVRFRDPHPARDGHAVAAGMSRLLARLADGMAGALVSTRN